MARIRKKTIYDGLFEKNPILISGLIAAPVIVCTDTFRNALLLCYAFSSITFLAIMISSFLSRKLVYGLRIIVYTILAALVYVPVSMLAQQLFPTETLRIGVYFPLLAVNSMITTQTEFLFDRRNKFTLMLSVLCYILGFDLVVLLLGFLRELLAFGTVAGVMTGMPMLFHGLASPAGGFLLTGLLAVLWRKLRIVVRQRRAQ